MRKFLLMAAALLGSVAANAQIIFEWSGAPIDSVCNGNIYTEKRIITVGWGPIAPGCTIDTLNTKCVVVKTSATIDELLASGFDVMIKTVDDKKFDHFAFAQIQPRYYPFTKKLKWGTFHETGAMDRYEKGISENLTNSCIDYRLITTGLEYLVN